MCINIGNRREVLWDDFLIDKANTTANLVMHRPEKKELAFSFDQPWESHHVSFLHCIKLGDIYRMYFTCGIDIGEQEPVYAICVKESRDLVHWESPKLTLFEFAGYKENNAIARFAKTGDFEEPFDNLFVFVDENPLCPETEKIKGIAMCYNHAKKFPADRELWCYTSADGIHFNKGWKMTDGGVPNGGIFDTLNTAWYDKVDGCYKAFIRGIHKNHDNTPDIRDIRYMESKDFKTWSDPVLLNFGETSPDYPLYTNQAQRYSRAPHMYIGMPTRYMEHSEWSRNFDQLGGEEGVIRRKARMEREEPRSGLAITDSVFMSSRDGVNWHRFDEMFMGPGLEHKRNWIYGDSSYPMYNIFETPCEYPSKENELSLFMHEGQRSGEPTAVYRYSLRLDGFASYHAGFDISTLTTKPFTFEGGQLSINFATSAMGFVYVDILDETGKPIEGMHSCELFGNSLDRTVYFGDSCDVKKFEKKPIRLRFTMRDADIYSFIFR